MSRSCNQLRFASYNIHQCVGTDRRRDPERVAAVLREIDADVIGLQEVDARPGAASDSMQMQYLASALGLHAVAGPTIVRHDGHYGNALLSRRPVLDVRRVDLTVYRREPRAAIDADVDIDGDSGAGHRDPPGPACRANGASRCSACWKSLGAHSSSATVLCGDINEWFAVGRPLRWLNARLGRAAPCERSRRSGRCSRWIGCGSARARRPTGARRTSRATSRVASDHLPLVADIQLP